MLKKSAILLIFLSSAYASAADFTMLVAGNGGWSWRSPDAWAITNGDSAEYFPTEKDNVILEPQQDTSNFYLLLQLPTGYYSEEISVNSFTATIGHSINLAGAEGVNKFSVKGTFKKDLDVAKSNGVLVAMGDGNLAIGPNNMKSYLSVNLNNVVLKNEARDKTAIMAFGGNDQYGTFKTYRMLASFKANTINLSNHLLFVGTENGVNANIEKINFEAPVNGNHGVLILNGDNQDEAWQQLQTIKVGGLESAVKGAGIITTKTASKRVPTQEQLKKLPKDFKSDDVVRNGHLEITGKGGTFSGEIKDNYSSSDTRGKVHITMNSIGGAQYFLGNNSYTGNTYILNGFLGINVSSPLGKIYLRGGALSLFGNAPEILDLEWENGKLSFDFKKNNIITILKTINIPSDTQNLFEFSNITPKKSYSLLELKNKSDKLKIFGKQRISITDKATGERYLAIFGASDTSLTVAFIPEQN